MDWKAEARKWQRAFHALEDEKNFGERIGKRFKPKAKEKVHKNEYKHKIAPDAPQLTFLF